jgi:hypothetical protein
MHVPTPSRRNQFKPGSGLARQFDGLLKAYALGHHDVVRNNGTVRCLSNSMASAFWRGYDSVPPVLFEKNTFGWAAYRAGQAQRLIDNERGVFVAAG